MTHDNIVFVLGDAFDVFEKKDGIIKFSCLLQDIEEDNDEYLHNKIFVIGQGIHTEQLEYLDRIFKEQKLSTLLNCTLLYVSMNKAGRQEVHKQKPQNIMVSLARAMSDSLFEADLYLDDRSELLDDHSTGYHLQGMVLIEAARQLFLTVTEQFFLDPAVGKNYYFVIHEMNIVFYHFTFPLDVSMRYEIIDKKTENPEKQFFSVIIHFTQMDKCVAEVKIKFTAVDGDRLSSKERILAHSVLRQSRERVLQNITHQEA